MTAGHSEGFEDPFDLEPPSDLALPESDFDSPPDELGLSASARFLYESLR